MPEKLLETINTEDNDPTCVTFVLHGEDDTLGNSLRYVISTYKEVEACHYTRPHPTEDKIHFRIQTYDDVPALMMLKRGFEDLKHYAETIHDKFEEAERAYGIQS